MTQNNLKRFVRGFRTGVTKSLPEILSLIPFFDKEITKKDMVGITILIIPVIQITVTEE
jgi:hypothetical protein